MIFNALGQMTNSFVTLLAVSLPRFLEHVLPLYMTEANFGLTRSGKTYILAPPPPDLDFPEIPYCQFRVLPPDPHGFDGDYDSIGCERCY
jgi:micrococcal nuclease